MKKPSAKLAAIGVSMAAAALLPLHAKASEFDFSYTLQDSRVLSGTLDGTLQDDGNTVFIVSLSNLSFAGAPAPALPLIDSFSNAAFGDGLPAATSLNGTFQDFIGCTDFFCSNEGFGLTTDARIGGFGYPSYQGSLAFGNGFEPYNPGNWSLRPVTGPLPHPVPGPLPLLGAGAAFGWSRKLRKRIKSSKPEVIPTTTV